MQILKGKHSVGEWQRKPSKLNVYSSQECQCLFYLILFPFRSNPRYVRTYGHVLARFAYPTHNRDPLPRIETLQKATARALPLESAAYLPAPETPRHRCHTPETGGTPSAELGNNTAALPGVPSPHDLEKRSMAFDFSSCALNYDSGRAQGSVHRLVVSLPVVVV